MNGAAITSCFMCLHCDSAARPAADRDMLVFSSRKQMRFFSLQSVRVTRQAKGRSATSSSAKETTCETMAQAYMQCKMQNPLARRSWALFGSATRSSSWLDKLSGQELWPFNLATTAGEGESQQHCAATCLQAAGTCSNYSRDKAPPLRNVHASPACICGMSALADICCALGRTANAGHTCVLGNLSWR